MIEYKPKYTAKLWNPRSFQPWQKVNFSNVPQDVNFEKIECRIDGKVYKDCTKEFVEEFHKMRTWERLNG